MPGIPPTSSNPAGERHDALVRKLGYEGRPTFITGQPGDRLQVSSHVVRQALTAMRIQGVYALGDGFPASASLKPIVYTAFAHDWQAVQAIRKDVWSQAAVPFLLVATPDTVEICSGFAPPSAPTRSIHFDRHDEVLPDVLADFSAERISSSLTWNDFDIRRKSSVDNELVDAIEALNERARHEFPELEDERDLINAMIGRFIYTYVLADRQILSPDWLAGRLPKPAPRDGSPFVNAVFGIGAADEDWTARAAFEVFDIVDEAINGSVFSLSPEQRSRVPDGLCRLIHRTVRRGEKLYRGSSQLGFFDVSFAILRTETISAIYERFVSIEGSERRRDDGVFYTPPHLADHVLDRVEAVSPIDERSRLLDPAAGSGIFLVGAFRRVMEKHAPDGGWHPGHINRAKSLLLRTIHGIEKHPQAANVCRFSLYLTLLDYVGCAPIEELVAAAGSEKFLPDLSGNVRSSDAFEVGVMAGGFSHVVGNPPWTSTAGQRDRSNKRIDTQEEPAVVTSFVAELRLERISFAHNRLSDLFTWLALRRHAADGGTVGFVLPTRSLIGRSAHGFAHQLARETTVRWVGNLSHLRRKLFEGGEAPACVVVAVNRKPTYLDRAAVYRPLLTSLPGGRTNEIWALLASNAEIRTIRSADLQHGRSGWFLQCMLGELDRRMHEAFVSWSVMNRRTVGDFLKRSRLVMSKGGSFEETGRAKGRIRRQAEPDPPSRPGRDARRHARIQGLVLRERDPGPAKPFGSDLRAEARRIPVDVQRDHPGGPGTGGRVRADRQRPDARPGAGKRHRAPAIPQLVRLQVFRLRVRRQLPDRQGEVREERSLVPSLSVR